MVDSQEAAAGFYNGSEFTSNDIKGKETPTEEREFKYQIQQSYMVSLHLDIIN